MSATFHPDLRVQRTGRKLQCSAARFAASEDLQLLALFLVSRPNSIRSCGNAEPPLAGVSLGRNHEVKLYLPRLKSYYCFGDQPQVLVEHPRDGAERRGVDNMANAAPGRSGSMTDSELGTQELTRRVMSLEQRLNARSAKPGRQVQDWAPTVTLIALVIYGSARFGDAVFYARLGTNPDAVGLNYAVTLSRVATVMAVAGAGMLAIILVGIIYRHTSDRRATSFFLTMLIVLGIAAVGYLGLLLVMLLIPASVPFFLRELIAVLIVVLLYVIGYNYKAEEQWIAKQERFRPGVILVGSLSAVVIVAVSGLAGYRSAGYVMRGELLPCPCVSAFNHNMTLPWSTGTSGLLGLTADQASITWVGPGKRKVPTSAILLGGSDGNLVFYDPAAQRTITVPSTDVVVQTEGHFVGWNE